MFEHPDLMAFGTTCLRLLDEYRRPPERYPLLRGGEREPIDPYKRRLIYIRDGYACQWCGHGVPPDDPAPGRLLDLDHIIPWSARGSDRSDNLRSLCWKCNECRSNYRDPFIPRVIGVVRRCYWCARSARWPGVRDTGERIPAFCGACRTASWVPDEGWIL